MSQYNKFAPLEMAQKGVVSTQYSMGPVEELGLLKMDFLGLSNLTIIKNTMRIIKKVYGKDIDISTIPLDGRTQPGRCAGSGHHRDPAIRQAPDDVVSQPYGTL